VKILDLGLVGHRTWLDAHIGGEAVLVHRCGIPIREMRMLPEIGRRERIGKRLAVTRSPLVVPFGLDGGLLADVLELFVLSLVLVAALVGASDLGALHRFALAASAYGECNQYEPQAYQ
jgi:hypothetical protein